jgi:hypothetical protein
MTADAAILSAGAAIIYAWLCATVPPIAFAISRLTTTRGAGRAWGILALATAGSLLWTLIAAAAALLAIVLVPGAVLAVLLSPMTVPGLSVGVMLWALQIVITARVPRVGPVFELETALALLSAIAGKSPTIASIERVYGSMLIEEPLAPASLGADSDRRSAAVWRVTA